MTPIRATPDNPAIVQDGRIVARRSGGGQHPGRRGRARLPLPPLRQRQGEVGRPRGAGDHAGRRGLRPRRGAAVEHRRGPPLPREVAGGGEDLPARRQGAAARAIASSTRTTPRRCAPSRRAAPTRSTAATSRRRSPPTWKTNGGIITYADLAQYRAHRARAGGRALPRPHALCRRPAGVDGHPAVRVAAGARATTTPKAGRPRVDRRRLLPLPDRGLEGARSAAARGRPGALARGVRRAPDRASTRRGCSRKIDPRRRRATSGRPPDDAPCHAARRRSRASAAARRRSPWPMPRAT